MTQIAYTTSKHRLSAKLATGVAVSAMLALGAFAAPANAEWDSYHHRDYRHYYNGGYYSSPPVVYGSPIVEYLARSERTGAAGGGGQ